MFLLVPAHFIFLLNEMKINVEMTGSGAKHKFGF